jgi:hypothetical protein
VQGLESGEVPALVKDAAHGKPKECPEGRRASRRRAGSTWVIDNTDDSSPTRQAVFVGDL